MTMVEENLEGHIQIPEANARGISQTAMATGRDRIPFVVCCLFVSSITSNVVPNRRLSRVPAILEVNPGAALVKDAATRTLAGTLTSKDGHHVVCESLVQ